MLCFSSRFRAICYHFRGVRAADAGGTHHIVHVWCHQQGECMHTYLLLSLLTSYTMQCPKPGDGAAHSWLGLLTSIRKTKPSLTYILTGQVIWVLLHQDSLPKLTRLAIAAGLDNIGKEDFQAGGSTSMCSLMRDLWRFNIRNEIWTEMFTVFIVLDRNN